MKTFGETRDKTRRTAMAVLFSVKTDCYRALYTVQYKSDYKDQSETDRKGYVIDEKDGKGQI